MPLPPPPSGGGLIVASKKITYATPGLVTGVKIPGYQPKAEDRLLLSASTARVLTPWNAGTPILKFYFGSTATTPWRTVTFGLSTSNPPNGSNIVAGRPKTGYSLNIVENDVDAVILKVTSLVSPVQAHATGRVPVTFPLTIITGANTIVLIGASRWTFTVAPGTYTRTTLFGLLTAATVTKTATPQPGTLSTYLGFTIDTTTTITFTMKPIVPTFTGATGNGTFFTTAVPLNVALGFTLTTAFATGVDGPTAGEALVTLAIIRP